MIVINFPNYLSQKIQEYMLDINENPYISWREIRHSLSCEFVKILQEQLECDDNRDLKAILDIIHNSAARKTLPPATLIREFPIDREKDLLHPPSDANNYNCHDPAAIGKKTFVAELALLALMSALKLDLHINPKLQDGWFVQHVAVKQQKQSTGSHAGAGVFPLHSDGAHLLDENLIDAVALLTLRNGKTNSILVSYDHLAGALRDKMEDRFNVLFQKRFMFKSSAAYDIPETTIAPIIYKKEPNARLIWRVQGNRHLLSPADENDFGAIVALDDFFSVIDGIAPCHHFALRRGDLLIVDNLRGFAHTREPIDLTCDVDRRRHLIRAHGRWAPV